MTIDRKPKDIANLLPPPSKPSPMGTKDNKSRSPAPHYDGNIDPYETPPGCECVQGVYIEHEDPDY